MWAAPCVTNADIKVIAAQVARAAIGCDQGAAGEWIHAAIRPADLENHQFTAVVQLEGEPVPSHLVRRQGAGAELVIHPAQPIYLVKRVPYLNRA